MKAVLKLLIIISIVFCFSVSCKKHKITEGVYVVGSEDLEVDDSKIIAKYWKNCSSVILYDGVHSAFTTDIKVIGNDVYVNLTNLTKGEQFKPAKANDIFVVKK